MKQSFCAFAAAVLLVGISAGRHTSNVQPRQPGSHGTLSKKQNRKPTSAPPSGLAQALEQVGVVFRPKPRHALADIHIECGWCERDGLLQPFLRFRRATELTESGGGPAIDH